MKRSRWRRIGAVFLGLVLAVAAVLAVLTHRPPDIRAFQALLQEEQQALRQESQAFNGAHSPADKKQARAVREQQIAELAEHGLALADKYPDSTGELAALIWATTRAPDSDAGRQALERLERRVPEAELPQFRMALLYGQAGNSTAMRPIAARLLQRLKQSPDDPVAGPLLAAVCTMTRNDPSQAEPDATFREAADLIVAHQSQSEDINHFIESVGGLVTVPAWGPAFQSHLEALLKTSPHRRVRCAALFSLAAQANAAGRDRTPEAQRLYEQFLEEFDGQHVYSYQGIEQEYVRVARIQLEDLRTRGLGMPAPEIDGVDVAGQPMRLSAYRGKVVLLSFWATWCFPCMKFIPHEKALAERLAAEPFAIVGVNGDTDAAALNEAVATQGITWRSFRDVVKGQRPISDQWGVLGWPTVYLIDHEGIIREKWVDIPPEEELQPAITALLAEARSKASSSASPPSP